MPARPYWAYFCGVRVACGSRRSYCEKFERLSTTLLGLMFFLFVCMLYLPSAAQASWQSIRMAYMLRDLSFCAGAWALAGLHSRAASPRLSRGLILFAAHRAGNCGHRLWRAAFSPSNVRPASFGNEDAGMGSNFPAYWLTSRSDPAGCWNRPGHQQKSRIRAASIGA